MDTTYTPAFYDTLDPGIRSAVKFLHDNGFDTADSGDGETKVGEMECALEFAHIVVPVDAPSMLISEAIRLRNLLEKNGYPVAPVGRGGLDLGAEIQATYDPHDQSASILLMHFTYED